MGGGPATTSGEEDMRMLATRADAAAASCRTRASDLRVELASHYADFVGRCSMAPVVEGVGVGDAPESGLEPESARDAFDIQLAQCEEVEDQLAALDIAEEHLKTGENGKALGGYLSFLMRALGSGIQEQPGGGGGGGGVGGGLGIGGSSAHPSSSSLLLPPGSPLRPGSPAGSDGGHSIASSGSVMMAEPRRPGSAGGAAGALMPTFERSMSLNQVTSSSASDATARPLTPMALGTVGIAADNGGGGGGGGEGGGGVAPLTKSFSAQISSTKLLGAGSSPTVSGGSHLSGMSAPPLSRSHSQVMVNHDGVSGGGGGGFTPPPPLSRARTQSGRRRSASARRSSGGGPGHPDLYRTVSHVSSDGGGSGSVSVAWSVSEAGGLTSLHGGGEGAAAAGGGAFARAERCRVPLLDYFHSDLVRALDRFASTPKARGRSMSYVDKDPYHRGHQGHHGDEEDEDEDESAAAAAEEAMGVRPPHENQQAVLAAGAVFWLAESAAAAVAATGVTTSSVGGDSSSSAAGAAGEGGGGSRRGWAALEVVLSRYTARVVSDSFTSYGGGGGGGSSSLSKAERDATAAAVTVAVRNSITIRGGEGGVTSPTFSGNGSRGGGGSGGGSGGGGVGNEGEGEGEVEAVRVVMKELAATAEWQLCLLATLPEHPPGEFLGRLFGAPAADAIGRALDVITARIVQGADGGGAVVGGATAAAAAALQRVGQLREEAEVLLGESLPAAAAEAAASHLWRPTLAVAPSAARHARAAVETAFSSRRHRLVEEIRRRGTPAATALRAGEREAAAAIVAGSGGVHYTAASFTAAPDATSTMQGGADGGGGSVSVRGGGGAAATPAASVAPVTLRRRDKPAAEEEAAAAAAATGGVQSDENGNGNAESTTATATATVAPGESAVVEASCAAALLEATRVLPAVAALPPPGVGGEGKNARPASTATTSTSTSAFTSASAASGSVSGGERADVINAVLIPVGASIAAAVSVALEGRIDRLGRRTAVDKRGVAATARALGRHPPPRVAYAAACVARNTAAAASALMIGTELAALRGCSAFAADEAEASSSSLSSSSVSDEGDGGGAALRAAATTAAALATRLSGLVAAAEARAVHAWLAPAATALEGTAAQTWAFHRKPEAMANAPKCSPHVISWRSVVGRGVRRIVADFSPSASAGSRSVGGGSDGGGGVGAAAAAVAVADLAGAEAAGLYLRLAPSRAWRDRFVWDCRTVAVVLCAVDVAAAAAAGAGAAAATTTGGGGGGGGWDEGRHRRGQVRRSAAAAMARGLVTRAALLSCPADVLRARLPAVAATAEKNEAAGPADDDAAAAAAAIAAAGGGGGGAGDLPPEPSVGHPWGPGSAPEQLWTSCSSSSGDGDAWAWLPSAARRGLLGPAWPSPKEDKEALAEVERAWAAVEEAAVSSASPPEVLAALWRRSEMNAKDVTPLEEEEAAAREALRAAVEGYR